MISIIYCRSTCIEKIVFHLTGCIRMFKTFVQKMSRVNINFKLKGHQIDDPANVPCLIVGLGRNINKLGFEDVKHKLKDKVSEEVS